jgi:hypothetical protein
MNILSALRDSKVFAPFFRGPSWDAWRAFLATLFAIPMTAEQLALYQQHTGRSAPPTTPFHEAWLVIGRRGGKSFVLATIAVFLACFFDWRPFLGPGEIGTIMVVAADRRQARTIMRYCIGLLKAVPMLKRQIEGATRDSISLKNRIVIEVHTASFRSTRGYTIVAALLDELAFFEVDEDSASPDVEVINAIKPGMATIPGALLLCASSPHSRRGALFDAWKKHYGKDGDPVLVWQAPTRAMNPSVPQSYIDEHVAEDPARAAAEYGAQFRIDLEAFVQREAVERCVSPHVYERPPQYGIAYTAFVDPSGGSVDSMTLAIGHNEPNRETAVIDALREVRPPFSPEATVIEFCTLLKSYRLSSCVGDKYGGEWPREAFQKHGVRYEPAAKPKSDIYIDALALLNSGRIDLLDNARAFNQLVGLERRTARSGKDSVDHQPGGHDDVANVICGAATLCVTTGSYNLSALADTLPDDPMGIESWRSLRLANYLYSDGGRR